MNFIEFFQSNEITLSSKLLEIIYLMIGLVSLYTAYRNFMDKENKKRIGTAIFWGTLGLLFVISNWIPPLYTGILVVIMVIPAILQRVGIGSEPEPTQEEMETNFQQIGMKIFIPALCIGIFALLFALFTQLESLVGIGFGVLVAIVLMMLYSRKNKPVTFLKDARRMLDIVGPLSMLPTLLAALGAIFTAAGVGEVISSLVSGIIPEGNVAIGIIVYALGMVIFTMIMGNAFAAITVMTVGIGAPFVLAYGADPVIIGSLALTCGYCGTLCTPMAANFNMVPVAILDMKDRNGVIKKQVFLAAFMLVFQICYMIFFS